MYGILYGIIHVLNKKNIMAIKKTDFSSIKNKFSKEAEYKADRFFDLGDAFLDATGIPGPAMGHINMLLGHSDTGKTTALVKAAVDAQKKNIIPVFIITEQKWNWEHAELMGFDRNGDYLFNSDFEYIEQITDYINELIAAQDKGDIPHDLLFLWDSVGSVPCKMTYEGKGGKQHNASVLSDKIGMGINQRISGSRRTDKPYTNTLIIVNQPWVELPDNPFGQPKIKAKGGEAIWLNSTLVFLFGNQKGAGTTKIKITRNKRDVNFASRTKISIMKNHVNGLGFADGKIMVTPHGFMKAKESAEEKISIQEYAKENLDYISKLFGEKVADISELGFKTEISSDDDE
jgi:recA bacterial DNA recombination protein